VSKKRKTEKTTEQETGLNNREPQLNNINTNDKPIQNDKINTNDNKSPNDNITPKDDSRVHGKLPDNDYNEKGEKMRSRPIRYPVRKNTIKLRTTTVLSALLLIVAFFSCSTILLIGSISENRQLKNAVHELYSANSAQRKLLNEKNKEIAQLRNKEAEYSETVNRKIEEFTNKFNSLTDKYIASTKVSRSGGRDTKTFAEELSVLKDILDELNRLNNPGTEVGIDLSESEKKLNDFFDRIPTLWPVSGRISDNFGTRADPFTNKNTTHEGIDIAASSGTPVKAAASGTVTLASTYNGYGKCVIIDHGQGLSTLYGHASELLVKKGQKVEKGEIIAKVGSTGRSTGPHLHFEVRVYDTPVDPRLYLE